MTVLSNVKRQRIEEFRAAVDAVGILHSVVASDCPWCGGEGGWSNDHDQDSPLRMTPVIHREVCPITQLETAKARLEKEMV